MYKITVSRYGKHYFTISDIEYFKSAEAIYNDLCVKYPSADGWNVSCMQWETIGTDVQFDE